MTQCHDIYETDPLATAHIPLLVKDVMTPQAVTVEPTRTIKEIAQVLLDHDIGAVPVVDTGEVLVGVVSEADVICRKCPSARRHTLGGLVDRLLGHDHDWADKAEGLTAEEIMTKEVISCAPTEPVSVAARRLLSEDVRMIPVLEDRRVVGVLTRHDVLRIFDRPDHEVKASIAKLLASPMWAADGHNVSAEVHDGVVRLSGSVRYPSDREYVDSMVAEVAGVIEVKSDLTAESREPKHSYLENTV